MTDPKLPVLVPPDLLNNTVSPPAVRLFPLPSFARRVTVTADPDATLEDETVTVEVFTEAVPGVTVTVGRVVVTEVPPMVALRVVAVPETTPVKVAV